MKRTLAGTATIIVPPLAFFALVVGLWQAVTTIWEIPAYLVPSPARVWSAAREHAAELVRATGLTAGGATAGFALSLAAGTALGLVFSQSKIIERSVYPYAIFLQTVPIVAIAPLVVMWCGNGFGGVVAVAFILSLFPIITNATAGLTSVDPQLLELFEVCNASRWQTLWKLRFPAALPFLFNGLKIATTLALIGAIVAEFFGSPIVGMGFRISTAVGQLSLDLVWAEIAVAALAGSTFYGLVALVEKTVTFWHPSQRGRT